MNFFIRNIALAFIAAAAMALPQTVVAQISDVGKSESPLEQKQREDTTEPSEPYTVTFTGNVKEELLDLLEQSSQLRALTDKAPSSTAALRRRIEGDVDRFKTALRSEGYYAGEVRADLDEDAVPPAVTIHVEPGPAYKLESYAIEYRGNVSEGPAVPQNGFELDLEPGMQARAPRIVAAQQQLLERLAERGRPLAEVLDRRSVVHHGKHTMDVTLSVDPGPLAHFGPLTIDGLDRTDKDYIREFPTWEAGEIYDQRKVDALRKALNATGLFEGVTVTHASEVDAEGALPVQAVMTERAPRSIGGGASYSTSEGIAVEAFWEHRNFFGRNEKLQFRARAGMLEQSVRALAEKPRFHNPNQKLLLDAGFSHEDTDAYEAYIASSDAAIERELSDIWSVRYGAKLDLEDIDDKGEQSLFLVFGVPLSATRDSRNDILNPTSGSKLRLATTPYISAIEDQQVFLRSEIEGSAYLKLDDKGWIVLAGRGLLGSIVGADTNEIPATKRFYSGGGGSVRGYEFQRIGPLDADLDPIGGSSVVEMTAELRVRVTESIGLVPFLEGGNVYDDSFFDGGNETEFRWSAGLGLRYFTAVGPIRLDIAFPLNKRENIDDDFQFYISIGQAF
jgi:translocation and assembly module TamA